MALCEILMINSRFSFFRIGCHKTKINLHKFSTTTNNKADVSKSDVVGLETGATDLPQVASRPPLPLYTHRKLSFPAPHQAPVQAWVSNLDSVEEEKLGMIDLHPDVYGVYPRMDMIHQNVKWQLMYKRVNWVFSKTRAEMPGGGRKPWPQKGTGRARHGSIRSPLWKGGGKAHGPRGPKPYFYMLPFFMRVHGLVSTLSAKLAQDDLYIVDSLDIPTDESKYLENVAEQRHWGLSILFVDDTDIMPRNISLATDKIPQYNLMPAYGLNVYSMLKHETVVLTLAAAEKIEERLLYHQHRIDSLHATKPFSKSFLPYSPLLYEHLLPKSDVDN